MAKPQNLTDNYPVVDPETGFPTTFLMQVLQGRGKLVEKAQLDILHLKGALEDLPATIPIVDADALGIDPYQDFYLNASIGDDNNDGLSAATAWQTFDYAIGYIAKLRWRNYAGYPNLHMASGLYSTTMASDSDGFPLFLGCDGLGVSGVNGDNTAVVLDTGGWFLNGLNSIYFDQITLNQVSSVWAYNQGYFFFSNCRFYNITGASGRAIFNAYDGGKITIADTTLYHPYLTPTAGSLFRANNGSVITLSGSHTIDAGLTVDVGFAVAQESSSIIFTYNGVATTFTGSVTGPRYLIQRDGIILSGNPSTSFLPGSTVGIKDASSWYDHPPAYGPVVSGATPAVFVQNPDGSLILSEYT